MNILTNLSFAALLFVAPLAAQRPAQPNVITTDIHSTLDAVGDGMITVTLRMNAREWATWKSQFGSNPSLFRRELTKMFTQYELTDFALDQDDMNRKAVVRISGKSLATFEDGVFEIELDKQMATGELVDGEYRVTYTEPQGPNTITLINQRIRMPDGASSASIATSSSGKPVLRYRLAVASATLPWMWFAGIGAVLGTAILLCSFRIKQPSLAAVREASVPTPIAS